MMKCKIYIIYDQNLRLTMYLSLKFDHNIFDFEHIISGNNFDHTDDI